MSRRLSVYLLLAALALDRIGRLLDRDRRPGRAARSSRSYAARSSPSSGRPRARGSTIRGGLVRRSPARARRSRGDRGADRRRRASVARRASRRATSPTSRSVCCSSAGSPKSATTAACGWSSCCAASARRPSPSSKPRRSSSRAGPTWLARSRSRRCRARACGRRSPRCSPSDPRDVLVRDREGVLLGKAQPAADGTFEFTPERGVDRGAGAGAGDRRPGLGAAGAQRALDGRSRDEPDGAPARSAPIAARSWCSTRPTARCWRR